ncbi:ankyrin repeat domain-containing protein [Streptomyces subrutilus]|uniref:ankyrin repeat domain-containing protein n=1 Tax=Streptomyces subrutilus TaxID=36818 RepID=UPI000B23F1DC|nr:ankyrin repeat domain-containing protein [Streptomyces subrutilus]
MSREPLVGGVPAEELAVWHQVRRFAVPGWMIESATGARLAGDWREACAVAAVDIALDPARIGASHGGAVRAAVEADLAHLAPDLLRWHLPRALAAGTMLMGGRTVVLARHGGRGPGSRAGAPAACLVVRTPARDAPQRLVLDFVAADDPGLRREYLVDDWTAFRHFWDARRAPELRAWCGGDAGRLPFFLADGTPLGPGELPDTDPGPADPVAREEWIAVLQARGDTVAAFAAAGVETDLATWGPPSPWGGPPPEAVITKLPLDLPRIVREVRRLRAAGDAARFRIPGAYRGDVLLEPAGPGAHAGLRAHAGAPYASTGVPTIPGTVWRRLPDLQLVRTGRLTPEELHPLVAAALFPASGTACGPPGPPAVLEPVRVRCGGEWHLVGFRDGELRIPHSPREQQREQALLAFGGAVSGCFAVRRAWATGRGQLPRALRPLRREAFERARHGDAPGIAALLAAGLDPAVRDTETGRSLAEVLGPLAPEAG